MVKQLILERRGRILAVILVDDDVSVRVVGLGGIAEPAGAAGVPGGEPRREPVEAPRVEPGATEASTPALAAEAPEPSAGVGEESGEAQEPEPQLSFDTEVRDAEEAVRVEEGGGGEGAARSAEEALRRLIEGV